MGTRVCLVASEPVTGAAGDWAEVPRNTALVVCRERCGLLNVLQAPLTACGAHPRQEEVSRCLEAVSRASGVTEAAHKGRHVIAVTSSRFWYRSDHGKSIV